MLAFVFFFSFFDPHGAACLTLSTTTEITASKTVRAEDTAGVHIYELHTCLCFFFSSFHVCSRINSSPRDGRVCATHPVQVQLQKHETETGRATRNGARTYNGKDRRFKELRSWLWEN